MINLILWLLAVTTFIVGMLFGSGIEVYVNKKKAELLIKDERLRKRLESAMKDWLELDLKE